MYTTSILLPVFNAAPWLNDCLNSILQQTEGNWELVAVDDFSTDESWKIIQAFAKKDRRIKVFQNDEKGIIPALRLAFENSTGRLITRMDADDIMMPNKLEALKKVLIESGKGYISTGLVSYFSENELGDGYRKYAQWLNDLALSGDPYSEIYKECVLPSPCWMMYRTDLVKCNGFDSDRYPEDYDLCFRFYQHNMKPIAVNQVLHQWRDHPERSSRTMEVYADNRFFDIKLDYFLALDYYHSRPIIIWGTGRNGKKLAQKLRDRGQNFRWVCNNPNKWGKDILGVTIESFKKLPTIWQPQVLISVASPDGKKEIQVFLDQIGYEKNYHYFYFV